MDLFGFRKEPGMFNALTFELSLDHFQNSNYIDDTYPSVGKGRG